MRIGSSCPGPSDSAVRAPIESVQYGVHYQQFSSQASTPSRTRSSRRRPSGRRQTSRTCPPQYRQHIAAPRPPRQRRDQRHAHPRPWTGQQDARRGVSLHKRHPPSKSPYSRLGHRQSSVAEPHKQPGVFGPSSSRASCRLLPNPVGLFRSWAQGELQHCKSRTYTPPASAAEPAAALCRDYSTEAGTSS